ncbi:AraC family transcriptional regulator [Bacillus solitudinis]|uniref:AraC family transcriptional regulator n=1 Tax=Bacillus solitudinis TaxID=2014074 RepID=UPI000C2348C4|nr:AraC family transcriptional regulator [Bacillus solitudinis]
MERSKHQLTGRTYFSDKIPLHVNRYHEDFISTHHSHDFIEITIIEEGKGFHHINGEVIPVNKGELFIIPIGANHVFRPNSANSKNKLTVYNVLFSPSLLQGLINETNHQQEYALSEWCALLQQGLMNNYIHLRDKQDSCLRLIRSIYLEYQYKHVGYSIVLESKVIELMILLFRLKNRTLEKETSSASMVFDEMISYIDNHFNEPLTLTEMATNMLVSPRHFSRLFKKHTSQTFTEYLQNKRMEESGRLLRTTDHSVREISERVGYKDDDYFRELFTKKFGLSPQKYRKARSRDH